MSEFEFNKAEFLFISKYKLTPDMFLVSLSPTLDRLRAEAIEQDKNFFIGPLHDCGCRLYTRSKHCIVCHPSEISFQLRWRSPGFVYIMGSFKTKMLKIGMSARDCYRRQRENNRVRYGQVGDWEVLFYAFFDESGRVEHEIQNALINFNVSRIYIKDNKEQLGGELFNCSLPQAYSVFQNLIQKESGRCIWRTLDFESFQ